MRFLARVAMKGGLQTFLLTVIFACLSIRFIPLVLLSTGIGAMYTLRKGIVHGILLFAIVAIITWALSLFVIAKPGLSVPVFLFLLVPVLACSYALLRTQNQGMAVLVACACGVIQAVFIELISGDAVIWWSDWIKLAISGIQGATFEGFERDGSLELFNGLAALVLAMATFLSVLLGRNMQASQVNPGGCMLEFCALQIPVYSVTLTIMATAMTYLIDQNLMYSILIVVLMMYFFQGFAVLHAFVVNKGKRMTYVLPAYFLLIVAPQFGLVGFAMVGILDVFINFRKLPTPARS